MSNDNERDLDKLSATEARDFVMARCGAAVASVSSAKDVLLDVLGALADGDHEFEHDSAIDAVDVDLGEASRAIQLARDLLEKVDPEEAEPEVPESDEDGEGDGSE